MRYVVARTYSREQQHAGSAHARLSMHVVYYVIITVIVLVLAINVSAISTSPTYSCSHCSSSSIITLAASIM